MKIRLLFLTAAMLIFSGCGTSRVSVTGTVKFDDGTPLEVGIVKFIGAQTQATGHIQAGGKYRLGGIKENDGIKPGSYQVVVAGASTGGGSDGEPFVRFIDQKYEHAGTSGLTCDVSGSTTFDITVTKPTKAEPPTPPRGKVPESAAAVAEKVNGCNPQCTKSRRKVPVIISGTAPAASGGANGNLII